MPGSSNKRGPDRNDRPSGGNSKRRKGPCPHSRLTNGTLYVAAHGNTFATTDGREFSAVPFRQEEIRPVARKCALCVKIRYTVSEGFNLRRSEPPSFFQLNRFGRRRRKTLISPMGAGGSPIPIVLSPRRPVMPMRLSRYFPIVLRGPRTSSICALSNLLLY